MTKEVKKVVSWAIQVEWSDGTVENLNDLPNGVANTVDEWLTENEKLQDEFREWKRQILP